VATKDIIVIRPRDTLASAMRRFTLKNLEELPVVETTEDGGYRFLGLITRREVIGYYNQTVDELRQQRRDEGYDQAGETSGSQRRPSVRVRSSETQHDDD
jgi:CIC family chloride channel protein